VTPRQGELEIEEDEEKEEEKEEEDDVDIEVNMVGERREDQNVDVGSDIADKSEHLDVEMTGQEKTVRIESLEDKLGSVSTWVDLVIIGTFLKTKLM